MSPRHIRLFVLQARLTTMRFGWTNGMACLLCAIGACAWLWGVPHMRAQLEADQQALVHAQRLLQSSQSTPSSAPRSAAEDNLARFYDALGDRRYSEQQVKTLFAVARKTNLVLSQAEYRWSTDKNGRYWTYQILLPVKGSYGAIRQFCEQTLLAVPFASLDDINFKREAIASGTLEAKLRFTLYLGDGPSATIPAARDTTS